MQGIPLVEEAKLLYTPVPLWYFHYICNFLKGFAFPKKGVVIDMKKRSQLFVMLAFVASFFTSCIIVAPEPVVYEEKVFVNGSSGVVSFLVPDHSFYRQEVVLYPLESVVLPVAMPMQELTFAAPYYVSYVVEGNVVRFYNLYRPRSVDSGVDMSDGDQPELGQVEFEPAIAD